MLLGFSWGEFVQVTVTILLFYYVALGMIFYRAELRHWRISFILPRGGHTIKDVSKSSEDAREENAEEEVIEPAQKEVVSVLQIKSGQDISKVYVELEEAIGVAKVKNKCRSELLESLKTIIEKYKNSIDKDVAAAIIAHIQSQLAVYSLQQLTDEELQQLWPTQNK